MFNIYKFRCRYPTFIKEGLLLEANSTGRWSEVSPLEGKNRETVQDALKQLRAVQRGWRGELYPSVTLGLYSLEQMVPGKWPVALLLMGSPDEIMRKGTVVDGYRVAKLKIAHLDLITARNIAHTLKGKFRLRIDLQGKWPPAQVFQFCSYFAPSDFEFIEDPGCDITPYPMEQESGLVWKPMVRGIPHKKSHIILSSVFESGVGISQLVSLAERQQIQKHPLGIGTYHYLEEDILANPLSIQDGYIDTFTQPRTNTSRLQKC